ncbi:hypothetical protein EYW49_21240 [Siculibacillus lacustris]|uniref:TnsA endonuclease N-terminal domain-containing protein n=1 Tax=Siculibacillus lacustris TaxID=1549641 RepID=A0A4Q9VFP5_9HYPH|nr:hypothetical protein [Siculibacillus lacustris]TBW32920.1 hypothetical protein EYW49_21240 [Siculibacillus lacustris]
MPQSTISPADLGLHANAVPMRNPPLWNRGRALDGVGGDYKCLGRTLFRSILELRCRRLLSADKDVLEFAVESHQLKYRIPTSPHDHSSAIYTPDITVRYRDGRIVVVEAKAEFFANKPYWKSHRPFIQDAYEVDHGIGFIVKTEWDINAQPALSNSEIMLRYRYRYRSADGEDALRRMRMVLATYQPPATIRELIAVSGIQSPDCQDLGFAALMNLALWGEVDFDPTLPITYETRVIWGAIE